MILCAGEALIDMLPRDATDGRSAFAPFAGGSVFNTAIALGRLGAPVGLFTGLSTDMFGTVLENTLVNSHVDTRLAARSDRPTTLAFVELTDGHAKYAFYDENTAGRMLVEADLPTDLGDTAALFFGGISLAVTPCAEAYAKLCLREAEQRTVMIDPNIRPDFIKDEAAYRARLDKMIAVADIIKLSDEDLVWLRGEGNIDDLAQQLVAEGPKLVCITKGAKGVTGYTAGFATYVPADRAKVVDTVGAGDTFNAGLLAGLHQSGNLMKADLAALDEAGVRNALGLGTRVAAVTVSRAGANPPWAHEL
jgi:fructokinase